MDIPTDDTTNRLAKVRISLNLIEKFLNEGTAAVRPVHNLRDIHIIRAVPYAEIYFNEKIVELFISSPNLEPILVGQPAPLINLAFEQVKG